MLLASMLGGKTGIRVLVAVAAATVVFEIPTVMAGGSVALIGDVTNTDPFWRRWMLEKLWAEGAAMQELLKR